MTRNEQLPSCDSRNKQEGGKKEARPIIEQNSLKADSVEALAIKLSRGSNNYLGPRKSEHILLNPRLKQE